MSCFESNLGPNEIERGRQIIADFGKQHLKTRMFGGRLLIFSKETLEEAGVMYLDDPDSVDMEFLTRNAIDPRNN